MNESVIQLRGHETDAERVGGYMLFPNDERKRQEYWSELNTQRIERFAKNEPSAPITMIGFDLLQATNQHGRSIIRQAASENREQGIVAGKILAYMHALSLIECPKYAGLRAVREMIHTENIEANAKEAQRRRSNLATDLEDSTPRSNAEYGLSTITECWTSFRGVAHLWAAYLKLRPGYRVAAPLLPSDHASLSQFFGVANAYLEFGVSFEYERARTPRVAERHPLSKRNCWVTVGPTGQGTAVEISVPRAESKRLAGLYCRRR